MSDSVKMDDETYPAAQQAFMIERAKAIQAYSDLEQALCSCLAYFGDMPNVTAGTIFFKINNARAVAEILGKLNRQKHADEFNLFWNSLVRAARCLAETRNSIVHWAMAAAVYEETGTEKLSFKVCLKPPNYWGWTDDTPELWQHQIEDFTQHCRTVQAAIEILIRLFKDQFTEEAGQTWREICQQPLAYPLPPEHPLFQSPR